MRIQTVSIHEILDSRGNPTIEVTIVTDNDKEFSASVPAGKSKGTGETHTIDTSAAIRSAVKIERAVRDKDFTSVEALDTFLIELDGTHEKKALGGNVLLGISVAFARALAAAEGQELWLRLRGEFFASSAHDTPPRIFSNLINGGAHAKNNLDIQEYMAVVTPHGSVKKSVERLKTFYHDLGGWLQKEKELTAIRLGDEGGYSLDFRNNFEPLAVLGARVRSAHLEDEFALGIDAAASGFFKNSAYAFGGKQLAASELKAVYTDYAAREPLLYSFEDPFAENDGKSFAALRRELSDKLIVGDDLTVTDPALIERYAGNNSVNGVIIKPNQIGTVSETCKAIHTAWKHRAEVIVSHRSGETDDTFIIHLARACGAFGVKIGAPIRERLIKFNELVKLYQ